MAFRFPWMTSVDNTILSWLEQHDVVITPSVLFENLRRDLTEAEAPSQSHLSRRLRMLRAAGLLEKWDGQRGKYVLSDLGRAFLDNQLPDDDREQLANLAPEDLLDYE